MPKRRCGLDDWRRRAMMGEAEVKRLEKRAADLEGALERQQDKLMTERDGYRNRLNNLVSQFHSAGAIILKCLDAANTETSGGQVNLGTLAAEIERVEKEPGPPEPHPVDEFVRQAMEEPLPSVVARGPAEPAVDWLKTGVERKGP